MAQKKNSLILPSKIPDGRSDEELFLATVQGEHDDDAPWAAVRELHRRNTEAVFHLAVAYCESEVPLRRARGLDVLGQLGAGLPDAERPYLSKSVELALTHLAESDDLVASSAAWALSHLSGERAVTALIQVRTHREPSVRLAVACGMAGCERPEAIETLKILMEDADDDVRNWATFAG